MAPCMRSSSYHWGETSPSHLLKLFRFLWLPEELMEESTTFLLCWLSSLEQRPGLPSPPFQEDCANLELRLWEAGSGWLGVMMEVPSDLRWPIKSDVAIETLTIVIMSLEIKVLVLIFIILTQDMTLLQNHCWLWSLLLTSHQVLEYHPQPWNKWLEIGNLQVERSEHAALSIGPQQLSCLSSGGSFNGYDDNSGPSDLDRGSSL